MEGGFPGGLQEDVAHPCALSLGQLCAHCCLRPCVRVVWGKGVRESSFLFCVSGPAGNADVSDGFCLMVSFLLGPGYYRWNRWKQEEIGTSGCLGVRVNPL